MQIVLTGLPLILPTSGAAPAVDPKANADALKNSNALLDPADFAQVIAVLSALNFSSLQPLAFISRDTGLQVA